MLSDYPASAVHLGDYRIWAKRVESGMEYAGKWMLTEGDGHVNAGPAGSVYETQEQALHAIRCLMATDATLSHSDRFWALMRATGVGA